jgi:TonB family protein
MSGQRRAFAYSLGIHLVVCVLIFGAIRGTTPDRKPLVIDFTLEDQPRTTQIAQPLSGTVSESGPGGVHRPVSARVVRQRVPPARDLVGEPAPQARRVAVAADQVAVVTPEPTRSSAPDSGSGTLTLATPEPTPSSAADFGSGAPTPSPNPEMAGTGLGVPESGIGSGPADSASFPGPGASLKPGMASSGAGAPGSGGDSGPADSASFSGPGSGTERAETRYVKAHFAAIRNAILGRLSYPPFARRMGWTGTVKVSFVVVEDGSVSSVKVLATSGHEVLDNNVIEAITRGSPYPKPPAMAEIIMPIRYRLDE